MQDLDGRELTILEIPIKMTFLIFRQSSLSAKGMDTHSFGILPPEVSSTLPGRARWSSLRKMNFLGNEQIPTWH